MNTIELLFPKNSTSKDCIITKFYANEKITINKKTYMNYDKLVISTNADQYDHILKIISESLVLCFKFRVLNSALKDISFQEYDRFALVGALLSVDKGNEVKLVKNAISKHRIISFESLMEFRLNRLSNAWKDLGDLSRKLAINIRSRNELYELISYFISSIENQSRVTLTDTAPINIVINGEIISPMNFTQNHEFNLLLTVISEAPSHVIIKNQDLLSNKLLETFRALGQ